MRWAVVLLVVGLVVAFAPGLTAAQRFLSVVHIWDADGRSQWVEVFLRSKLGGTIYLTTGTSATTLVRTDAGWAAIAITLVLVPGLFAWWRGAGFRGARTAGIACAAAASASVVALIVSMRGISDLPDGVWWTVPVGGLLMATAFFVTPSLRQRDE